MSAPKLLWLGPKSDPDPKSGPVYPLAPLTELTTPVTYTRHLKTPSNDVKVDFRYTLEGRKSVKPDLILDRTEACQQLHISRQTLLSWIRKGKLKIWKRVGHGSNAALLFERKHIENLMAETAPAIQNLGGNTKNDEVYPS